MPLSPEQSEKAETPISVILLGSVKLFILAQCSKAHASIVFVPSSIVTLVSEVQNEKARRPMFSTLPGIKRAVTLLQSSKA